MPAATENLRVGRTLDDWLAWQECLNPRAIALGLERTDGVARRLGLLPAPCLSVIVGGTNGKGSTVTLAAAIWQAAGYKVGRYISPHLKHYRERIAVDNVDADDAALLRAFEAVEAARGDTPLTYFEFGTLAALWLFRETKVDVQVLEVGLGGRLDAVNVVDADAALITNIGLDHLDWLGPDRDAIGAEKAGIARAGRPLIYVDEDAPRGLTKAIGRIGADWRQLGQAYSFEREGAGWHWRGLGVERRALPAPGVAGAVQFRNAAGVLALVESLQAKLPVARTAIDSALREFRVRGRYEAIGRVRLDVAHNVEAAAVLADALRAEPCAGQTHLVLGMLSDKPVEAIASLLAPLVDTVRFASLPGPRGLRDDQLAQRAAAGGLLGACCGEVEAALRATLAAAAADDRIVVCGSFLTVADALKVCDE